MRKLTGVVAAAPSYYDAGVSACVPGSGHDHYPFCDVSLPIDERVTRVPRDLVVVIKSTSAWLVFWNLDAAVILQRRQNIA